KLCDRVAIIREGKIIEEGTLQELRHLTRMNMTIRTKLPISNITELKGIHSIAEKDGELNFQVDADEIDAVIRHISSFGIEKLESLPPTLENLFLRYYESAEPVPSTGGTQP